MKAIIATVSILVVAAICGCQQKQEQPVARLSINQTANTAVESLVEQLVSPVPAKYPTGETLRLNGVEDISGYIHPRVEDTRQKLVMMGTTIYPILVEHIHDDRYSYSGVYAAWVNHSVGQMIGDIMADGIEPNVGGYKWRENSTESNGQPHFGLMVKEFGGYEKYAEHAKRISKADLQKEYVLWHIAKERSYGFKDDEQEKQVIGEYLKLLEGN